MRVLTIQGVKSLEVVNLKEVGGRGRLESTKPIVKVSDKVKHLNVRCRISSVEDRNRITKKTGSKTMVGEGRRASSFWPEFFKTVFIQTLFSSVADHYFII